MLRERDSKLVLSTVKTWSGSELKEIMEGSILGRPPCGGDV